ILINDSADRIFRKAKCHNRRFVEDNRCSVGHKIFIEAPTLNKFHAEEIEVVGVSEIGVNCKAFGHITGLIIEEGHKMFATRFTAVERRPGSTSMLIESVLVCLRLAIAQQVDLVDRQNVFGIEAK